MTRSYGYHVNPNDFHRPREVYGLSAFGDTVNAELTPAAQADFVYGGNPYIVTEHTAGTGTITYASGLARLEGGASTGGAAYLHTVRAAKCRPGQGALFRFSALFEAPLSGVGMTVGLYTGYSADVYGGSEDAVLVGYDSSDGLFGLCVASHGVRAIHELTVTVASSGAETVTVTLNGVATNVSTTAGTIAETAQEIAEGIFAGWTAQADGSHVHFVAHAAEARGGTYSLSSTGTAAGTFAQDSAGAVPTVTWTKQTSWSVDKFDGTGPSGMILNPETGNEYQIRYQTGFGEIELWIQDPQDSRFMLAHRTEHQNANTLVHTVASAYFVGLSIENVTATNSSAVCVSSMSAFFEGKKSILGPLHAHSGNGNITAETPVISIRNNYAFIDGVNKVNLRDIVPMFSNVSVSANNKSVLVELIVGGTLTDPLWTDYLVGESLVAIDSSATAITGGDTHLAYSLPVDGGRSVDISQFDLVLTPGAVVSIVLTPTGPSTDYVAMFSWKEDI